MDCLMWIVIGSLFVAVLVLLWRNHRITKEVEVFAEKIEETLDAIVTGKEWNLEEKLEDSLWGRTVSVFLQIIWKEIITLRYTEKDIILTDAGHSLLLLRICRKSFRR